MERTSRIKILPTITLSQWLRQKAEDYRFQDPYHKDVRYSLEEVVAEFELRKTKS